MGLSHDTSVGCGLAIVTGFAGAIAFPSGAASGFAGGSASVGFGVADQVGVLAG